MNEKKLFDQILQAFPVIRNYIPQDIKGLSERFLNYVLDEETYIPSPSLENYLNNYLCTIDKRYKSTTEKAIRHFLDFYNFSFEYINEDDILKFIQEEYSKGNSQGYIRVVISRLRQFYSFLEKENVISVNPFENINLSTIKYESGTQYIIPTEKDIKTIIKNLPIEKAIIIAIMSIKGYSINDFYDSNFSFGEYENSKTKKRIFSVYCWRMDDIWDYLDDEKKNNGPKDWKPINIFFGEFSGYYQYIESPKWYNDLLFNYWIVIKNEWEREYGHLNDDTAEHPGIGELYYMNNYIPLDSYENFILKKIHELFQTGKIEHDYSLKNFRYFAISRIYTRDNNIKRIQKMLKHSTPNTTRRFLQNIGIEIKNQDKK